MKQEKSILNYEEPVRSTRRIKWILIAVGAVIIVAGIAYFFETTTSASRSVPAEGRKI